MLEYYSNKKVGIFFSENPHISIRYYIPSMTEEERKSIERYPFINKKITKSLKKILIYNTITSVYTYVMVFVF